MESLKEIFETDDFQSVKERMDCEGLAIDSLSVFTLLFLFSDNTNFGRFLLLLQNNEINCVNSMPYFDS